MVEVGLTGGIGSGKSTALDFFQDFGAETLSADRVVHKLYEDKGIQEQVCELLSLDSFSSKKIAEVIFTSPKSRGALESFIHPKVKKYVDKKKKEAKLKGTKIFIYEVPLLFEKKLEKQFAKIICVGAEKNKTYDRIKKRNKWSDKEIQERMAAQIPLEEKKKGCDFYIDNSRSLKELKEQCQKVFQELSKESS